MKWQKKQSNKNLKLKKYKIKGINIKKKKASLVVKNTRPVIIAGRKDKIKGEKKRNSEKKWWVTTYLNYYLYQQW
jgi:hypothetical protein